MTIPFPSAGPSRGPAGPDVQAMPAIDPSTGKRPVRPPQDLIEAQAVALERDAILWLKESEPVLVAQSTAALKAAESAVVETLRAFVAACMEYARVMQAHWLILKQRHSMQQSANSQNVLVPDIRLFGKPLTPNMKASDIITVFTTLIPVIRDRYHF